MLGHAGCSSCCAGLGCCCLATSATMHGLKGTQDALRFLAVVLNVCTITVPVTIICKKICAPCASALTGWTYSSPPQNLRACKHQNIHPYQEGSWKSPSHSHSISRHLTSAFHVTLPAWRHTRACNTRPPPTAREPDPERHAVFSRLQDPRVASQPETKQTISNACRWTERQ